MSVSKSFYVGYKACGCPVAAVNAEVATADDLADTLAEMKREGYRVEHHTDLPHAFLYEHCTHGADAPQDAPDGYVPMAEREKAGQQRLV